MTRATSLAVVAVALWIGIVAGPPLALWRARAGWMEQLQRPEAQIAWDTFRRDMAAQADGAGPVRRKVPRSLEPPLRVWIRDYFGLAVAAWFVFAGVVGLLGLVLVRGAIGGRSNGRAWGHRDSAAAPPANASPARPDPLPGARD